jgi:exportin-2 (importin alpha re-exporter)
MVVSKIDINDHQQTNGVLYTAHSIFKRYRNQFMTDDLVDEITYVLNGFAKAYLEYFKAICSLISKFENDQEKINEIFKNIHLLLEIYYSLNWLDFPEFFEDNLKGI